MMACEFSYAPIKNFEMASLYVPQCSPIAPLTAMYKGSRSIRGGGGPATDLVTFGTSRDAASNDLGGRMGVVEMGRLKAAGSISGMVKESARPPRPSTARFGN